MAIYLALFVLFCFANFVYTLLELVSTKNNGLREEKKTFLNHYNFTVEVKQCSGSGNDDGNKHRSLKIRRIKII